MKQNKKHKFNTIVSCLGVFALAFLFACLPFIKNNNSKLANAYVVNSDVPTWSDVNTSSLVSSTGVYSSFCNVTSSVDTWSGNISDAFNSVSISIVAHEIVINQFNFDFSSTGSYLEDYLPSVANFDYVNFIKLYFMNLNYSLDNSEHLYFRHYYVGSSSFDNNLTFDSCGFDVYKNGDSTPVFSNTFSDTSSIYFIRNENSFFANVYIDFTYLCNYLNCVSYVDFFENYYFTFVDEFSSGGMYSMLNQFCYGRFENSFDISVCHFQTTYSYLVTLPSYSGVVDFYYNSYSLSNDLQIIYENKLNEQLSDVYSSAYSAGYIDGTLADVDNVVPNSILAFASFPFTILGGFLNFNLFGFNLYNLLLAFVTAIIIIWLIKKIK